jgi:hypothetical protein
MPVRTPTLLLETHAALPFHPIPLLVDTLPPPTRARHLYSIRHPQALVVALPPSLRVPGSGAAAALFTLSARHALTISPMWAGVEGLHFTFTHNG